MNYILRRSITLLYITCAILSTMLLVACDVTKTLPAGEQLYMGVKQVKYTNNPSAKRAKEDTVGVIGAIAQASSHVKEVLHGQIPAKNKQEATTLQPLTKEQRAEAKRIERITNNAVNTAKDELEAILLTPPNGAFLGSAKYHFPINFGLMFYTGFYQSTSPIGKWIFKVFAKQPKLISGIAPRTRAKVAQGNLFNQGFMAGRVSYDILPLSNPKKAYVKYNVSIGPLWRYGFIRHSGFTPLQDSLLRINRSATLLHHGDAFNAGKLEGERNRIARIFRENGFYFWRNNFTLFQADTTRKHCQVDLKAISARNTPPEAKRQWVIGQTYVRILRNLNDHLGQRLEEKPFTFYYSGKKIPVRPMLWQSTVMHRRGQLYNFNHESGTLAKLNTMNIFQQLDINYVPHDTLSQCDTLDVYINGILDKPYNSDLEMNATFKSNQQAGPGISYTINKKNAFRGGEKLSLKFYGSYEWQLTSGPKSSGNALNSYELGSQLSLTFPRLLVPFARPHSLDFPSETKYSADFDWKKRSSFFTMISAGLSSNYTWNKYKSSTHTFSPLSLEFDKITNRSLAFDSITQANPALYISMRNQLIPSLYYTFTYASSPIHTNNIWIQLSAKEAGNLLSCGFLIGKNPFSRRNKRVFGIPYAQFLKTTVEVRNLFQLSHRLQLATRLYAGSIWSYGNSSRAPYNEEFYVGGANSVRGFTARTIGPGAYKSHNTRYSYIDQIGDIRLEANAELRFPLFGDFYGATFLDAGNVWLMRKDPKRPDSSLNARTLRKIAVSSGLGLRYDLSILVLRFDLGVALHAPYATSRKGFYNIPKFKDSLNLHFAIGYPF